MPHIAKLALEDGTVFTGTSFGAEGEVDGEVCFNTSMTGYQEILTDPSYRGQIVTMTYTADRQLRRERRRRGEPQAAPGRVHRPREQPAGEQLPRRRRSGRLSETLGHRRPRRDRHPGAGPPAADPRGHERRALLASISTTPGWWPRPRPARAWSAATWCAR